MWRGIKSGKMSVKALLLVGEIFVCTALSQHPFSVCQRKPNTIAALSQIRKCFQK